MKKKKHRTELIALHYILESVIIRRHYFLPLLSAICSCLLFVAALSSFLSPPIINHHRHHLKTSLDNGVEVGMKVEEEQVFHIPMRGGSFGHKLWTMNRSNLFYGCSNASKHFITVEMNTKEPNRYLLVATSGGLNQQRIGITDAVVAAYILKATLVVPKLDQESFWKDASNFSDIFDVEWFMRYLSKDVNIIKQLPENAGKVITTHVPRKCDPKCYHCRISPIFDKKRAQAVQLLKFDYRLSNWLDEDLQKLRCRVNYHALRFTDPILEMGRKLVERMRMKSKHFVALHLRYEPDMLAFSGCYYGGGEKEMKQLSALRKRWTTLQTKNPDRERRHGKCPLSPEEVGLMLRALGFGNDVHIYVASGEIYGGEVALAPLKSLFPNFYTKESIATEEELAEFSSYSSQMAALDFIVCDESDVFVTNNNGNMAKILAGRRRYFGHKPTIRPNAKKLYRLFLHRDNMAWEEFSSQVRTCQIGFMGEPYEVKPGRGVFHENPFSCICKNSDANNVEQVTYDEMLSEDEQDLSDTEYYTDDDSGILGRFAA
ncbi:hypothetical protein CDL12_16922 [Handroanthus impetiginosus]|uniref:O-fucosyltransferase family protein n=1 Tax=Handroanthus impetiginosus TaxID=429701 RepID=A0A2G9GZR3_9LAMI|nr:hypothetical protein CDL12_16922 [Handroanthus impetiginosus]